MSRRQKRKDGAVWYVNRMTGTAHASRECRGLSGSKAGLEQVFVPWGVTIAQVEPRYFRRFCGWCT